MTRICGQCGGTRLAPSHGGGERGSCNCKRPGRVIAHLYYGSQPATYQIEWQGEVLSLVFQSVESAYAALDALREQSTSAGA